MSYFYYRVTFSKSVFPACIHTGAPIPDDGLFYAGWFEAQEYAKNYLPEPTMVTNSEYFILRYLLSEVAVGVVKIILSRTNMIM